MLKKERVDGAYLVTLNQESLRKEIGIPAGIVAGAPGIGKSRLLQEYGGFIEKETPSIKNVNINITYGNGTTLITKERELINGSYIAYEPFWNKIAESFEIKEFTPSLAMDCINLYLVRLHGEQEIIYNIGVDEFQKTLNNEEITTERQRLYLKNIVLSLSPLLLSPSGQIIHEESAHPYVHIPLRLLNRSEYLVVAQQFLRILNLPKNLIVALDCVGG
eukprot:gene1202-1515_t